MKRIILPGLEYIGLLVSEIKPYAGLAAEITDHTPFMQAVLDDYLHGTALKDPKEILRSLRVPTEVSESLVRKIQGSIAEQFSAAFHPIRPSNYYIGVVTASGDFYIDEHPHSAAPVFKDSSVVEVLEEGGWCSERERRKVGLT